MANDFISITDAIVYMDNASNTLTEISDQTADFMVKTTRKIGKFATFGLNGTQKTAGKTDFTGSIGVYPSSSQATSEAHRLLNAWNLEASHEARSFRVQYPDAAAGAYQYDFEALCTDYELMKQDANGDGTPPLLKANIEIDGEITATYIS